MRQVIRKIYCYSWYLLAVAGLYFASPSRIFAAGPDIMGNLGKTAQQPFGADVSGKASITPGMLVGRIVQVALGFTGTVAFVIFLYGGFLWLTARGNEEQVTRAKKYLTNGVIGTIVIMLAFAATYYVIDQLYSATR